MTCAHLPLPDTTACATCPPPPQWDEEASCRRHDPELWFADHRHPLDARQAIAICQACPVRPYCLEEGWTDPHGIWGGWTAEDRDTYSRNNPRLSRPQLRVLAARPRDASPS